MDSKLFQLGIYGLSLAGYVALAIKGEATAEYVTLVGPVLGAGFLASHLGRQDAALRAQDQVLSSQDAVLSTINTNTNGILDKRIRDAVNSALDSREAGG